MAKWKHQQCKGHVAAGLFDGKTFRKVCITEDQTDAEVEENVMFAKEISDVLRKR